MTHLNLLRGAGAILFLLVFFAAASAQQTLNGEILTNSAAGNQPRFNVKLYPPKSTQRAILVTSSDGFGKFRFTAAPDSYLLELYLGSSLVYQEVIKLDSDTTRKIDLRKQTLAERPPS
ncbi:MAG TPA: hypothetical protein VGO68_19230 [Pyrinomonadaceae bacterium]|jgi:hypothetical protein|nr:hypothetical protein [Pyrinomonadaceae bacterium]